MGVERVKQLARRYEEEVHNQKNLEVIDEIIAPHYENNGPDGSYSFTPGLPSLPGQGRQD